MSTNSSTIEPPLDYSDDGGHAAVVCLAILAFIASVIVALRFWAKRLIRQSFGLDSYLCLAALIVHHILLAGSFVCILQGGLGRDMRITATENPHSVVVLYQAIYVSELAYTYCSPLIKLSVLAFYRRIFPTPAMKLGTNILASACIAWCIAITILDFVECRPLKAFWFVELQALPTTKCLDPILCFLANSIANSIIDFFTLTLPIREVFKLQITTWKKIQISGVFLMGGMALAASLVRTVSTGIIWKQGISNFTKQFFVSGVATVIEIYVAIIGSCLPTLVPVYRRLRYGVPYKRQNSATHEGPSVDSKRSARTSKTPQRKQFANDEDTLVQLSQSDNAFTATAYSNSQLKSDSEPQNPESYQLDGVVVRRDMTWSENSHEHSIV
ncbi:uncharacterized protein GGS25DRAFT_528232 [Hypoxylon fragiforme]|uniref:uncharacterized protein n=1 Tax=Hypoxylon fragiforme TaxID=63214 RepID=UPI0020C61F20|nr:uncharacterized protein GGS25DRAFT_528232 [Hypoxylon fragiforme]KAI2603188.1 hypothetical protein GGS25DRAFT_528232 [Hypoxylon fragiforme]